MCFRKASDYIFDEAIVEQLYEAYQEYLLEQNSDAISQKYEIANRLKALDAEIANIAKVIMKTGSEALTEKLSELENEKKQLEFSLSKLNKQYKIQDVSIEDLHKSFKKAKQLFLKAELKNTKKLMELYMDSVIIYEDYIELRVKVKPDIFPHPSKNEDISGSKGTVFPFPCNGAEGGKQSKCTRILYEFLSS